jgi:hypothetical protein
MRRAMVCSALVLLALGSGCQNSSGSNEYERRVLDLANRHAEQQSLQSRQMAELQKQWQTERTQLNEQRDRLEVDRMKLSIQRQREPLIAESIQQVGTLALCLLPLGACMLLLRKSNEREDGDVIAETLVSDLMSAKPTLFAPALPAPTSDDKPAGHLTSAAG